MKSLRVLSGLLLFLAIAVLAGAALFAARAAEPWSQGLDFLRGERWPALGAAAAVLFALALYVLSGIRPRRYSEPFITFENESGAVSVSTRAIGEVVSRVGDEFAAVLGLDSAVRPAGGSIEVTLDVKVRGGTQIPELCRMLQDRVRDIIRENLGLTEIRGVRVTVREIVGAAREARKTEEGAA
ncbi:MAG: hypothetical protein KA248_14940 [Kiritimatiellae bacterium]|nr:hypothetical protein [Kiritimatiellia bacterium]